MRNPFRRNRLGRRLQGSPAVWDVLSNQRDDHERRVKASLLQFDPSPEAGEEFWRLAFPDLEAGFWATRREIHAQNGWTS